MNRSLSTVLAVSVVGVSLVFVASISDACTRCVYLGPADTVVVARSMDWSQNPGTNLFCLPRGMNRDGAAGPRSITWTSKYGSIVCAFYEVATVDGMNEKGLIANVLYLVESDYGKPDGRQRTMSVSAWCQYVLDNFATVAETVEALGKEPFVVVAPMLPDGHLGQGHLSVSDPTGDSAIFEYIDGKLHIHHGREYQVMTNSPTFDKQLAINTYWEQVGGFAMLPGTNRAADRFARASFFIATLPPTEDMKTAVASVFSVIRGVSVPLGTATPGQPNIASTIWRTVYDQKNRVFYFDSAASPTVFWVPLADLDFNADAPVKKLTLTGDKTYGGNAASAFEPAKPFVFLRAKSE
ncbi:MAG TPA: choloylglycine hydrolase [Planctomycetaceae bacterium]|nr:choloylglycine hydrolase [Planctomycetaceae bacterium]